MEESQPVLELLNEQPTMTDKDIIQGLIERDNQITEEFFFVRCRPLFQNIINKVFNYEIEYDELVNELYLYLMDNEAAKLKSFEYRSSVYHWLKVLAIHFFIKKRKKMTGSVTEEPPYDKNKYGVADENDGSAKHDLHLLLSLMPNKRYVYVIQRLLIDDWETERLAKEMNVSVENLYNIKKRAMAQLTRVALHDIRILSKNKSE